MKEISRIELEGKVYFGQGFAGYCKEAERYLCAFPRGFAVAYHDYYFIDEAQYHFLKEHEKELKMEKIPTPIFLKEVQNERPAGANYYRDYMIGQKVESRKTDPLPYKDGPFLYDGAFFYYHLILKGRHYAVPPVDLRRNREKTTNPQEDSRGNREKAASPSDDFQGFASITFDDEDYVIRFFGKDVTGEIEANLNQN